MRFTNVASAAAALVVAAVACAGACPMPFDVASLPATECVSVSGSGSTVARSASTGADLPSARVSSAATVTGFVRLEDGSPVAGAVIVSALGGQAVSERDGSFTLALDAPVGAASIGLTAVATAKGVTYTGRTLAAPVAIDGTTEAGVMVLSSGGGTPTCEDLAWLPTFGDAPVPTTGSYITTLTVFDDGGGPALYAGGSFLTAGSVAATGVARWNGTSWSAVGFVGEIVYALTVFDDGLGGGPALYAGGFFNYVAKWNGASWSQLGSGMNSSVHSLAVFDDGSGSGPALYAGGMFTIAGGVTANRIAKWNGSSWSALSSGVDQSVFALTVFDDGSGGGPALYAGGGFITAGGVGANRIAKWNGSTWASLGSGTNGTVRALTVFDDGFGSGPALFAGGSFTAAGGMAASRIAKWNGTSWSPLGTGVSDTVVYALASYVDGSGGGPALYAGGSFTTAGGVTVNRIARWDGASWSPLNTGLNDTVNALTVFDDGSGGGQALYTGGVFTTAGGVNANRIARWNGTSWSPLGTGVSLAVIYALTPFDDGSGDGLALYAGGTFTTNDGVQVLHIARWNGTSWSPLGPGGLNYWVYALTVFDDGAADGPALYAGGRFNLAGGMPSNFVARWNGSSWSALGTGLNNTVSALAVFDYGSGGGPVLYAGGGFTTAGGVTANRVARWNGTSWSALGTGMNGWVHALTVFDDGSGGGPALYAGGDFTTADGVTVNRIARWNGTSWSPLGTGVNSRVSALTVFDDGSGSGPALYAGGSFTTAGGVTANRIAKWNGSAWSPLGTGLNSSVSALTEFDDSSGSGTALYAGGDFATAGGITASRIARWDGTSWSALDAGVGGPVRAVTVFDESSDDGSGGSALYAGGGFMTSPGGDLFVAKWGCAELCAPADLNCDGAVDGSDLAVVLGGWGPCGSPCIADINGDDVIDGIDLAIVLGAWG